MLDLYIHQTRSVSSIEELVPSLLKWITFLNIPEQRALYSHIRIILQNIWITRLAIGVSLPSWPHPKFAHGTCSLLPKPRIDAVGMKLDGKKQIKWSLMSCELGRILEECGEKTKELTTLHLWRHWVNTMQIWYFQKQVLISITAK